MYGGDNCTFDYLVYSPSGKTSNSNPKLVQLCDYQENLKERFKSDSLRKLPEFKNYDFYYIPNTRDVVTQRLECLDVVHYKFTIGTNTSSKKMFFYLLMIPNFLRLIYHQVI